MRIPTITLDNLNSDVVYSIIKNLQTSGFTLLPSLFAGIKITGNKNLLKFDILSFYITNTERLGVVEYKFALSNSDIPTGHREIIDLQDNIRITLKNMKTNEDDFMASIERVDARVLSLEMDEGDLIKDMIDNLIK